jgi:uncharacterized membrane protein YdjX (TVP38/TMEM64 family)
VRRWSRLVRGHAFWAVPVLLLACLVSALLWPHFLVGQIEVFLRSTRSLGAGGWLIFAAVQLVVAVSGVLPASLLGIVAGATYGLAAGFALAAASTMAGAVLAFVLSRYLFRRHIEAKLRGRPRLAEFDGMIAREGWKIACLLRISPVMPFSATSYALGLSAIGLGDYLLGTLASLPALLGYVFMGTLADASLSAWQAGAGPIKWSLLALGVVATGALTLHIGRLAMRAGLVLGSALPGSLGGSVGRSCGLGGREDPGAR